MIKLIKNGSKFRLVNDEVVLRNEKTEDLFYDTDIRLWSTGYDDKIGTLRDDDTVYFIIYEDNDSSSHIPIVDKEIDEKAYNILVKELEKCKDFLDYELINNPMEEVLRVEFQKVFDMWACKVVYQNFDILKRYSFYYKEVGVKSLHFIEYNKEDNLFYVLGDREKKDNDFILVNDESKKIIEDEVRLINEKYGIKKRWRGKDGEKYYFITSSRFNIENDYEYGYSSDDVRYELGNYFRTEEEAEKFSEYLKQCTKDYVERIKTKEIYYYGLFTRVIR